MSEELKPCPFCGSPAKYDRVPVYIAVTCSSCQTMTEYFSKKDMPGLLAAWNTRPLETQLLEALESEAAIIKGAQKILTDYLVPDGYPETAAGAIEELLGLLDGPEQRASKAKRDAAIKAGEGQ